MKTYEIKYDIETNYKRMKTYKIKYDIETNYILLAIILQKSFRYRLGFEPPFAYENYNLNPMP